MIRAEEAHQTAICTYLKLQYPNVIFHVDNGSAKKRTFVEQNVMRKQQYKPGYPDITILHPVGKWHALLLEIKKDWQEIHYKDGTLKPGNDDHFYIQQDFMSELTNRGYIAQFTWSIEYSKVVIDNYMKGLLTDPYLPVKTKVSKNDLLANNFFTSFNL